MLYILAKEKMVVPMDNQEAIDTIIIQLNDISVPMYIENNGKLVRKWNCDNKSIIHAKEHGIVIKAHKTVYDIVLHWWAGHRIVATYGSRNVAMSHMSTRISTYQGTGFFTCEEREVVKDFDLTNDILNKIISQYDGDCRRLNISWNC